MSVAVSKRLLALASSLVWLTTGAMAEIGRSPLRGDFPSAGRVCTEGTSGGERRYTCGESPRGRMLEHSEATPLGRPSSSEREGAEFRSLPLSELGVAQHHVVLEREAYREPPRLTVVLQDTEGIANFESGRAELTPEGKAALDAIVERVRGKVQIRFEVVGHTDNQRISARLKPVFPDNMALSMGRALTVAGYLKKALSLPGQSFNAMGRGESMPVADNKTPEGMAKNRRTELRVWFKDPIVAEPMLPPRQVEKRVLRDACAPMVTGGQPFSISVDGMPFKTDTQQVEADRQRCVDVALERADIQVKYDPATAAPALNVWVVGTGALRHRPVEFFTYTNYSAWIKKAEVRVFAVGQQSQEQPLAILPVAAGSSVSWQPGPGLPAELKFLLRVYDVRGRFDETALKPLALLERHQLLEDREKAAREALTGWGENSLMLRNIRLTGGMVTVSGRNVLAGQTVTALGEVVPVDKEGRFAIRQILPPGPHTVDVAVKDAKGDGTTFRRNLNIPDQDWFYIAIADITVGRDHTSGPATLVTSDLQHYNNTTWVDGRGAFYLKGKVKGDYLLTASADTGEQPLKNLFTNFQSKDPYYLLRNIDPNKYYPVYGDDATIVDDAPTQGRFYVRLARGDSHVMWGNFKTTWTGTELTNYNRGLYGADMLWSSEEMTAYGEKRSTLNAFVANPGTLQSREDFRGTGGSLYWLRHQNLTQGSERLWLEVRDKDSGVVIERKPLVAAQDYEIDYIQGRIVLRAPLSSVADSGSLVQPAAGGGNAVFLVASYEYTPGLTAISGNAVGLRFSHWLNDHFRIGATRFHQGDNAYWQDLRGLDATLRYKPGTYLRVERARSSGPGSEAYSSLNGGFNFSSNSNDGRGAGAYRVETQINFSDLDEGAKGRAAGYIQKQEAGFSAPGQTGIASEATTRKGVSMVTPLGQTTELAVKANQRQATSQSAGAEEIAVRHKLDAEWGVSGALRRDNRNSLTNNASPTLSQNGSRDDVILRLDYRPLVEGQSAAITSPSAVVPANENTVSSYVGVNGNTQAPGILPATTLARATNVGITLDPSANAGIAAAQMPGLKYKPWSTYAFVQGTVARSGDRAANDRGGLGLSWQINDRLRLGTEGSGGSGGTAGRLTADYRVDDRSNYYLAYAMETESPETNYRGRRGGLTSGSHYRLSEQVGIFGESRWSNGAGSQSLTHAFGVDLAPNDRWTLGAKVEKGQVSDVVAGDLARRAIGLSAAYKFEKLKFASNLEYRNDQSNVLGTVAGVTYSPVPALGLNARTVWLMRNSLGYQATPAWRLLGKLNFSRSSNSQGAFYDGDYTEFVMGAAYRPIDNDRWNTLFKYTYFYNLPSPGQIVSDPSVVAVTGGMLDYTQRSQVLNFDTIYDFRPWLSLGAKIGFRWGDLRNSKTNGEWFSSRADLVVLRADLHFVKEWDAVLEFRRLRAQEAGDARSGFLVALYRHLTEHTKLGIGYNFTDFSDNLTDLSYRSRGWFINGISAY